MRIELFVKSATELLSSVSFLTSYPLFTNFNIPNKVKSDDTFSTARLIRDQFQNMPLDVCTHYSLKYNSCRNCDDTFLLFEEYITNAQDSGISKVLLISGGGEKKKANSLKCLQYLQGKKFDTTVYNVEIGVAFNPYFANEELMEMEKQRLKDKVSTGLVSHIWLQFGSDSVALRRSLLFLQNLEGGDIKIFGSVMMPSAVLLARMKFRPWSGVFLSERFLSSVDEAVTITREILEVYREFNVEPLVETALRTPKDVDSLASLLDTTIVASTSSSTAVTDSLIDSPRNTSKRAHSSRGSRTGKGKRRKE